MLRRLRLIIGIGLVGALIILGSKYIATLSISKRTETDNFVFYWTEKGSQFLNCLPQAAETSYQKISTDLQHKNKRKITFKVYDNPWIYNLSIGNPFPWPNLRATGNADTKTQVIDLLLPPFDDPAYQDKQLLSQLCTSGIAHEITHLVISDSNPHFLRGWWHEGIAMYEDYALLKGHYYFDTISKKLREDVKPLIEQNRIPSFQSLSTRNFNTFVSLKGYQFAYTFIDFVMETYGYEKLCLMVTYPNEYGKVFNSSEDAVWQLWREYLRTNYLK